MVHSRNIALDALRVMACALIVLMHSPIPSDMDNGLLLSAISYFTAPAIGIFFMISGALLLPVRMPTLDFLKLRVLKLLWPILFWSLAYMLIDYLALGKVSTYREILSIPFTVQGNPTLWFLYTLIGLYIISPIISQWIEKASFKEATIIMTLFGIAFCLPVISIWLPTNSGDTGYLYYFCGYGGYYLFGWYMTKWSNRIRLVWMALGYVVSIAIAVLCKICHAHIDFYSLFWYKSILTLIPALFWFGLFQSFSPYLGKCSDNVKKPLIAVSKLTFGIYMVHFAIIRDILWHLPFICRIHNYVLQCLLIAVITFISSWFISWLISFLPGGSYLIGWKRS